MERYFTLEKVQLMGSGDLMQKVVRKITKNRIIKKKQAVKTASVREHGLWQ